MSSAGDAFVVPFRDPRWASKALLQGLIALIPILGLMALCGWMLRYMDNLREGREELPPYGFPLARGMQLFRHLVGWGVIVFVIWIVFSLVAVGISAPFGHTTAGSVLFWVVASLGTFLPGLALLFLMPAIIANAWQSGTDGAFNFKKVVSESLANPVDTLVAAIIIVIGQVIYSAGSFLWYVGFFLTAAYGAAVACGAAYWFATRTPAREGA